MWIFELIIKNYNNEVVKQKLFQNASDALYEEDCFVNEVEKDYHIRRVQLKHSHEREFESIVELRDKTIDSHFGFKLMYTIYINPIFIN